MHASSLHTSLPQVTILRLPYYFYFSKPKGLVAVTQHCHFFYLIDYSAKEEGEKELACDNIDANMLMIQRGEKKEKNPFSIFILPPF